MSARSEKLKAKWADPEYRAKRTAEIKARWADPENRKQQAEKIKAANTRKRLAKEQEQQKQIVESPVVQSSVQAVQSSVLIVTQLQQLLEHLESDETPEVQQVISKNYKFGDYR